jgi:hypothetical protein
MRFCFSYDLKKNVKTSDFSASRKYIYERLLRLYHVAKYLTIFQFAYTFSIYLKDYISSFLYIQANMFSYLRESYGFVIFW